MKPIIILNGPPGCGKDTIASILEGEGFVPLSFKTPMFCIASAMLGPSLYKEFLARYNDRYYKEDVWGEIGCSPRQLMIKISESFVKPIRGQGVFGLLAADLASDALASPGAVGVVFSDGGFPSEALPLGSIPNSRLLVVHLYREGYTFDGDSRSYMPNPDLRISLVEGKPMLAVNEILGAI